MKPILSYLSIATLLFLIACKKEAEQPKPTATITYKPIVSWKKADQDPLIYEGDTVKYKITANASADITELNVYKVNNDTKEKTLLPGYPKSNFADKRSITDEV